MATYQASPGTTQRKWIFEDDVDDDQPQLSLPSTPESLYVTIPTEKFGNFLTLSAPARERALSHQMKQTEVKSARTSRKKSIFEAVKSLILDDENDDIIDDAAPRATTISGSESSEFSVGHSHEHQEKYKRRGSCTKFSLQAEIPISSDLEGDEEAFHSFRKAKTLQGDSVYQRQEMPYLDTEDTHHARRLSNNSISSSMNSVGVSPNSPPLTIDMLPIPRKGSRSRSGSFTDNSTIDQHPIPLASRSVNNSPIAKTRFIQTQLPPTPSCRSSHESRTRGCLTDPAPRKGLVSKMTGRKQKSPDSDSEKKNRRGSSRRRSNRKQSSEKAASPASTAKGAKGRISHVLPIAPFLRDSDSEHSSRKPPGNLRSASDHVPLPPSRNSEAPALAHTSHHERTTKKSLHDKGHQDRSRESTPKFGPLLKRLHLSRQDSVESFAVETEDDEVERTDQRTQRRNSTTRKPIAEPVEKEEGAELRSGQKHEKRNRRSRRRHSLNVGKGNTSVPETSTGSDTSPRTPNRKSWRPHMKKRGSLDAAASPLDTKKKTLLPPSANTLDRPPRTPKSSYHRRQEIMGLPSPLKTESPTLML
mmetsp:Transcript_4603/g.7139  ORF Transcript_4603/g.7139 Transcript_4603/m.7139 type:complete len:588 (-) Transcript_4603:509-2272(-)